MRKLGKIALLTGIAVVSLTIGWRPFIGPKMRALTTMKFEATPQRLEQGRYFAVALAGCAECHTQHDWNMHGAPLVRGTEGSGQWFNMPDLPGTSLRLT